MENIKWTYLSVCFIPSFIRLAEVKQQLVSTFLTQLLHYVECAFAKSLTHRVEEHKYQVGLFSCTKTAIRGTHQLYSRQLFKPKAEKTYPTK